MFPNADSVAMLGAPGCRHCGGFLHQLFFDASGRVEVPHPRYPNYMRSVPLFPSYTLADARAGLTAPPVVVCPHCDVPDPQLTLEAVNRHLDAWWAIEQSQPPPQIESD